MTRRAPLVAALGCAALVAVTDRPASAFSCDSYPWESGSLRGSLRDPTDVPVDVVFWELRSCVSELSRPGGCRLERGDETIPLEVDASGVEACSLGYDDLEAGDRLPEALLHYVPAQPLTPGATYTLQCEENAPDAWGGGDITVQVRDSDAPSSAPESLAGAKVELKRGDDSCCGPSQWIEVHIDLDAPYLREGGHVEAVYADGQVQASNVSAWGGGMWFPRTDKAIELTPVGADGTRGETIRLERDDIDRELIYMPCAVAEHTSPLALWLLAPLAWIRLQCRRRRGTRGGS